jgi:hypothetical protein
MTIGAARALKGIARMISHGSKFIAALCGATLLAAAPASAAMTPAPVAYSPWAALSAFAAPASSQALCGAAAAAAAGTAAQGVSGCVFPALDAPVVAPVAEAAPIATPAGVVAGGGIGILPLLAGLAALGGLAALLLSNGGSGPDQISVSP